MIFSELYSAYYTTVARILEAALRPGTTERELQGLVQENAFSESVLTILPSLRSGKWPLLKDGLTPVVEHAPTLPLTLLEKRWLKAICEDPRVRLFGVELPELADVEPLFTREDYRIYDQYNDGDPFEDEAYVRHFRLLLEAIRTQRPVRLLMDNRFGEPLSVRFYPTGFEYSQKDDKLRVLARGCRFRQFNVGRIRKCTFCNDDGPWRAKPREDPLRSLTLAIADDRNALERAMLHFAHFEKQAERLNERQYLLHLKYNDSDETEMVIRVLSFGPTVKVVEPASFVDRIRERLIAQRDCIR